MAIIKSFQCIRPNKEFADRVAALPYDVFNREEACEEVKREPLSFLKVDRPETQFPMEVDTYDSRVYVKARELLEDMIKKEILFEDEEDGYYVYELVMDGRTQTGLAACASIKDYEDNIIMKHENTRPEKEEDRIRHVDSCDAQTGPIFLAYRANDVINGIVKRKKLQMPLYEFTAVDGVKHTVWKIDEREDIGNIEGAFRSINQIYIADGHHRAASAVKVGQMRSSNHADGSYESPSSYFLSVLFPDEELKILPYNRVVSDLNGLDINAFLNRLTEDFHVEQLGAEPYEPCKKSEFGMYLGGVWYKLTFKSEEKLRNHPVEQLDVSLLQNYVFTPILGIHDPRTDKRIDFIGGIRGTKELERRVNGGMAAAFSMYPTSILELFEVSDANLLMPPKSTWFEPKLRSGLFIHSLKEK